MCRKSVACFVKHSQKVFNLFVTWGLRYLTALLCVGMNPVGNLMC